MRSRHVSTVIRRPPEQVYDYARDPANLGAWAAGLASGRIEPGVGSGAEGGGADGDGDRGDTLVVDSPMGRVSARFLPRNELGVLDHEVTLPDGTVTYNPLRVVPHPDGAEVIFTLRGVDDDEFEQDAAMVAEDLARLRAVFEGPLPAGAPPRNDSGIADAGIRLASPSSPRPGAPAARAFPPTSASPWSPCAPPPTPTTLSRSSRSSTSDRSSGGAVSGRRSSAACCPRWSPGGARRC